MSNRQAQPENSFLRQYREIRPRTARALGRHGLLSLLATTYQLTGRTGALQRNRTQHLYLHHLFDDEVDGFRRLLASLAPDHTYAPYSEAVRSVASGEIDRPMISFSFDDGLRSCLKAASILEEFGARGCFFVCPELVGETDYSRIASFCTSRLRIPPAELMSWSDLESLLSRGHEVGAHTMTHPALATLEADRLHEEIEGSRAVLSARLGDVRHFSWPYGRLHHFSQAAATMVEAAGFVSCASAIRGCHLAGPPVRASVTYLRRDHVVAYWPVQHTLYFLARNSLHAMRAEYPWEPYSANECAGGDRHRWME